MCEGTKLSIAPLSHEVCWKYHAWLVEGMDCALVVMVFSRNGSR